MTTYLLLLRGINVGGKNKVAMGDLRGYLLADECESVTTYIQSGNVVVTSGLDPKTLQQRVETLLLKKFKLDSPLIKVLVLTKRQLKVVVDGRPKSFGERPDLYLSDVIFLMDITIDEALPVFTPREGVDAIWAGPGVVYSQRLIARSTKSRLNKVIASPLYKSMTIRNWNTTTKLLSLMDTME